MVGRLPSFNRPPLPDDWLVSEILERRLVLQHSSVRPGQSVIEIGVGAHALATVPLAHALGEKGRVVAVEPVRWEHFSEIVEASGVGDRIDPLRADGRRLPLRTDCADMSVCVHGVRSLGQDEACVRVLREMLRVSPRLCIAESLPDARTPAQQAHLSMYNLREDALLAATGHRDDLRYRNLVALCALVERAGGIVEEQKSVDVDLPHALAYFPRSMIGEIGDPVRRAQLAAQWDDAWEQIRAFGEDQPPVGVVLARR